MPEGLTGTQLIAAARRAGYKMDEHKLKRLRDGGLIPRPDPRPKSGTVGIPQIYPPGTLEQLLAVCELRKQAWNFDELRVLVWWKGRWIDHTRLRPSLKALIEEHDGVKLLRAAYEEADGDPFEAAHRVLERQVDDGDERHPIVRLFLRRLGGNRADLYTVTYTWLVLAFGGEPEWDSTDVGLDDPATGKHLVEASPRELVERVMEIDRALSDDAGWGPFLRERPDVAVDFARLRDVGAFNLLSPGAVIDAASDAELDVARDRVSVFVDMLPVAAKAIEAMLGRDFAGLGFFRAAGQRTTAFLRALMARYGLLLPQVGEETAVSELAAALATNHPIFCAVLEITGAFPGYRKYLTPKGIKQLETLAAEERQHFQAQLVKYLADHPDVARGLQSTESVDGEGKM